MMDVTQTKRFHFLRIQTLKSKRFFGLFLTFLLIAIGGQDTSTTVCIWR